MRVSTVVKSNVVKTKEIKMEIIAIIVAIRLFIIEEATATMGTDKFACVKQSVYACLVQTDGTMSFGSNSMCAAEISLCPRIQFNELGYELCTSMCHQGPEFHAERNAIWNAYYENDQLDLTGAEMFIVGHVLCCDTCRQAMLDEGIVYAGSLDSGRYYDSNMKEVK